MMAITTSNSINVKPARVVTGHLFNCPVCLYFIIIYQCFAGVAVNNIQKGQGAPGTPPLHMSTRLTCITAVES